MQKFYGSLGYEKMIFYRSQTYGLGRNKSKQYAACKWVKNSFNKGVVGFSIPTMLVNFEFSEKSWVFYRFDRMFFFFCRFGLDLQKNLNFFLSAFISSLVTKLENTVAVSQITSFLYYGVWGFLKWACFRFWHNLIFLFTGRVVTDLIVYRASETALIVIEKERGLKKQPNSFWSKLFFLLRCFCCLLLFFLQSAMVIIYIIGFVLYCFPTKLYGYTLVFFYDFWLYWYFAVFLFIIFLTFFLFWLLFLVLKQRLYRYLLLVLFFQRLASYLFLYYPQSGFGVNSVLGLDNVRVGIDILSDSSVLLQDVRDPFTSAVGRSSHFMLTKQLSLEEASFRVSTVFFHWSVTVTCFKDFVETSQIVVPMIKFFEVHQNLPYFKQVWIAYLEYFDLMTGLLVDGDFGTANAVFKEVRDKLLYEWSTHPVYNEVMARYAKMICR